MEIDLFTSDYHIYFLLRFFHFNHIIMLEFLRFYLIIPFELIIKNYRYYHLYRISYYNLLNLNKNYFNNKKLITY